MVAQARLQTQLRGTASRYQGKLTRIKSLYRRGLARTDILALFHCMLLDCETAGHLLTAVQGKMSGP